MFQFYIACAINAEVPENPCKVGLGSLVPSIFCFSVSVDNIRDRPGNEAKVQNLANGLFQIIKIHPIEQRNCVLRG